MKMDKVANSGNDEFYTPAYAIEPILKYVKPHSKIWCPFDTEESEYVKLIRANGNKVIASHISKGHDFYTFEPSRHWDCIISNPPFGGKRHIFERALSFGKPFALLMALTWLNDSAPNSCLWKRICNCLCSING